MNEMNAVQLWITINFWVVFAYIIFIVTMSFTGRMDDDRTWFILIIGAIIIIIAMIILLIVIGKAVTIWSLFFASVVLGIHWIKEKRPGLVLLASVSVIILSIVLLLISIK